MECCTTIKDLANKVEFNKFIEEFQESIKYYEKRTIVLLHYDKQQNTPAFILN